MLQGVLLPAHQAAVNRQGQILRKHAGDFPGLVEPPCAQPRAVQRRRHKTIRQRNTLIADSFDQWQAQWTNQVQARLVFQLFYHLVNRIGIHAAGNTAVKRRRGHKTAAADSRIAQHGTAALANPRGVGRQVAEAGPAQLVR